jgi:hypothetical protein
MKYKAHWLLFGLLFGAVCVPACGSDDTGATAGNAGKGGTGGVAGTSGAAGTGGAPASGGSAGTAGGSCEPDPLKTNLPVLWNGNSVDMYDCPILKHTAKYNEPDAMIFKAIVYVESRFQFDAVGCTGNTGCCPQWGWSGSECGCLGCMQSGPSCGGTSTLGLLPDNHVDLETDPNSPNWANSVFNPDVAIELGIAGIAYNRAQAKTQFPDCTEEQYTMMAIGNFNSYGSTKSCTEYNFEYDNAVLDAYKEYSTASGWQAHSY